METRKTLFQSTILAYLLMQFKNGVHAIRNNKRKTALAFFMLLLALAGFAKVTAPAPDLLAHLFQPFACVLYVLAVPLAGAVAVTLSAIPKGARQTAQAFIRAHMVNAAGEPPLLLSRKEDEAGKGVLKLFTRGIPLSQFQDNVDPINSALNCHITRTTQGADKQTVMLYYSPGYAKLPDTIMLPQNTRLGLSEVLLGETLEGPKIWDMNVQANALYGGSTGSGKTTLANSTAIQLVQKKHEDGTPAVNVKIIDMKGGIDYPYYLKKQVEFADDPASALIMLGAVIKEMEDRKIVFAQLADSEQRPIHNLEDYNRHFKPKNRRPRIVIIADELADLTETYPGMDKTAKERTGAIINDLERLARQGRALGITLICCLQRPDATALPGSIKNNLNLIVAGKSQPVLSQILLGNNDAWDRIPSHERGMFLTQDGTLFRGYLLDPDTLKPAKAPDNVEGGENP